MACDTAGIYAISAFGEGVTLGSNRCAVAAVGNYAGGGSETDSAAGRCEAVAAFSGNKGIFNGNIADTAAGHITDQTARRAGTVQPDVHAGENKVLDSTGGVGKDASVCHGRTAVVHIDLQPGNRISLSVQNTGEVGDRSPESAVIVKRSASFEHVIGKFDVVEQDEMAARIFADVAQLLGGHDLIGVSLSTRTAGKRSVGIGLVAPKSVVAFGIQQGLVSVINDMNGVPHVLAAGIVDRLHRILARAEESITLDIGQADGEIDGFQVEGIGKGRLSDGGHGVGNVQRRDVAEAECVGADDGHAGGENESPDGIALFGPGGGIILVIIHGSGSGNGQNVCIGVVSPCQIIAALAAVLDYNGRCDVHINLGNDEHAAKERGEGIIGSGIDVPDVVEGETAEIGLLGHLISGESSALATDISDTGRSRADEVIGICGIVSGERGGIRFTYQRACFFTLDSGDDAEVIAEGDVPQVQADQTSGVAGGTGRGHSTGIETVVDIAAPQITCDAAGAVGVGVCGGHTAHVEAVIDIVFQGSCDTADIVGVAGDAAGVGTVGDRTESVTNNTAGTAAGDGDGSGIQAAGDADAVAADA